MSWFGNADTWLDLGFTAVVIILFVWTTEHLGNGGGKGA